MPKFRRLAFPYDPKNLLKETGPPQLRVKRGPEGIVEHVDVPVYQTPPLIAPSGVFPKAAPSEVERYYRMMRPPEKEEGKPSPSRAAWDEALKNLQVSKEGYAPRFPQEFHPWVSGMGTTEDDIAARELAEQDPELAKDIKSQRGGRTRRMDWWTQDMLEMAEREGLLPHPSIHEEEFTPGLAINRFMGDPSEKGYAYQEKPIAPASISSKRDFTITDQYLRYMMNAIASPTGSVNIPVYTQDKWVRGMIKGEPTLDKIAAGTLAIGDKELIDWLITCNNVALQWGADQAKSKKRLPPPDLPPRPEGIGLQQKSSEDLIEEITTSGTLKNLILQDISSREGVLDSGIDVTPIVDRALSNLWVMYTSKKMAEKGGFTGSDQSPYAYVVEKVLRKIREMGREIAETSLQSAGDFEEGVQNTFIETQGTSMTQEQAETAFSCNREEARRIIENSDPGFMDAINQEFAEFMLSGWMQMPRRFYTTDIMFKMIPHLDLSLGSDLNRMDPIGVVPSSFCPNCGRTSGEDPETGEVIPAMSMRSGEPQKKFCNFCTFADPETGQPTEEGFWLPSNAHKMYIGMPSIAALAFLHREATRERNAEGGAELSDRYKNLRLLMGNLQAPVISGGGGVTSAASNRRQFNLMGIPDRADEFGLRLFPVSAGKRMDDMTTEEVDLLSGGISIGEFLNTQGWQSPSVGRKGMYLVPFDNWAEEGWRIFTNPAERAQIFAHGISEQIAGGSTIPGYEKDIGMSQGVVETDDPITKAAKVLFGKVRGSGLNDVGAFSEAFLMREYPRHLPEALEKAGLQMPSEDVIQNILKKTMQINESAREAKTLGQRKSVVQTETMEQIVKSSMHAANWIYGGVISQLAGGVPVPDDTLRLLIGKDRIRKGQKAPGGTGQVREVIDRMAGMIVSSYPEFAGISPGTETFKERAIQQVRETIIDDLLILNKGGRSPSEWMETVGLQDEDVTHVFDIMQKMGGDVETMPPLFDDFEPFKGKRERGVTPPGPPLVEKYHENVVEQLTDEMMVGKKPATDEQAISMRAKAREFAEKRWEKALMWLSRTSTLSSETENLRSHFSPGPVGNASEEVFAPLFAPNQKKQVDDMIEKSIGNISGALSSTMGIQDPYATRPGVSPEMKGLITQTFDQQFGTSDQPYMEMNRLKNDLVIAATGLFGFGNEYGNEPKGKMVSDVRFDQAKRSFMFEADVSENLPDGNYTLIQQRKAPKKNKAGEVTGEDVVPSSIKARLRKVKDEDERGNARERFFWETKEEMPPGVMPGFVVGNYVPAKETNVPGVESKFKTSADYSPESIVERYPGFELTPDKVVNMRNAIQNFAVKQYLGGEYGVGKDSYAIGKTLFTALMPVELQMAFQHGKAAMEVDEFEGRVDPTAKALGFIMKVYELHSAGRLDNEVEIRRLGAKYPEATPDMFRKVIQEIEDKQGPTWRTIEIVNGNRGNRAVKDMLTRQNVMRRGEQDENIDQHEEARRLMSSSNRSMRRVSESTTRPRMTRKASHDGEYRIILHANTDDKRVRGLMFADPIGDDEVALFTFPRAGDHAFHNANVSFPLTLAFCDTQGGVVSIRDMEAMSRQACASGDHHVKYVIEARRGALDEVRVGDKMAISEDGMHIRFLR
jgi:uncharacterized membrane protein (UPF0127 family)